MKKNYLLSFALFLLISYVSAQTSDDLWTPSNVQNKSQVKKGYQDNLPSKFKVYKLNIDLLKNKLANTPQRKDGTQKEGVIISFPNAEGILEKYRVFEASVFEDELQAKYPNIRNYAGKALDNSGVSVRFSVTILGLKAFFSDTSSSPIRIETYTKDKESYIIYSAKDLPPTDPIKCGIDDAYSVQNQSNSKKISQKIIDSKLRTYRMAIASTAEYSQTIIEQENLQNETNANKIKGIIISIGNTLNEVNSVYERELGVTFLLVANNNQLVFLNAVTDPFTNSDKTELIKESQQVITETIKVSNFDIGHTFATITDTGPSYIGGRASLTSSCDTSIKEKNQKATAWTGLKDILFDSFLNTLIHEIGHQFGANHTFGSCGNKIGPAGVEPGSGSTIMSYEGSCGIFHNVTPEVNVNYFHAISLSEIENHILLNDCAVDSIIGNSIPVIESSSPSFATIPVLTPFKLEVVASDVDNDTLTYTFEQMDQASTASLPDSSNELGPLFRSIKPSEKSFRIFPDFYTINYGDTKSDWEVLPSVSRYMAFQLTVRDNHFKYGATNDSYFSIRVDENSGPFEVISQNISTTWIPNTPETIKWDVANTNNAPVNCSHVDIYFLQNGEAEPILLASNTPNDGEHEIIVPLIYSFSGRIMIQSVGNIFIAVNHADIKININDYTSIPDKNFEQALIDEGIETGILDGYVLTSKIDTIKKLNISSKGIEGYLEGIEGFIALEELIADNNEIAGVIFSNNSKLKKLSISGNPLTALSLYYNVELTELNASSTELAYVELSTNINLKRITLSNNKLASLNVDSCLLLENLDCNINPIIELNTSLNKELLRLNVSETQIEQLNLNNNEKLLDLKCSITKIKTLDLSTNTFLENLSTDGSEITALDLTKNVNLKELICTDGLLENLNLKNGNNENLSQFYAYNNPNLNCIEVDNVTYSKVNWPEIDDKTGFSENCSLGAFIPDNNFELALIEKGYDIVQDNYVLIENINSVPLIDVSSKNISDLTGIEYFSALEELISSNNPLENIDLSQNTKLINLKIYNSEIVDIDLSKNIDLITIELTENKMNNLDVSNNIKLQILVAYDTQLQSLDLSKNSNLLGLNCSGGMLTSLNLQNGNNTTIFAVSAYNNPQLTCIQVDDPNYSNNNWNSTIDPQTRYSEDCSLAYIPDDVFENYLIGRGLDDVLDDFVKKENIVPVTKIDFSFKNIVDLTGIAEFINLEEFNSSGSLFETLDLRSNLKLKTLDISDNPPLDIDLSGNKDLISIKLSDVELKNLDLSQNQNLTQLYLINNKLPELNVEKNTLLKELICSINPMTELVLTNNLDLEIINTDVTDIMSLDLSKNTKLLEVFCSDGNLSSLNIKNGNNTAITVFNTKNNLDLNCIQVDDPAFSGVNWTNIETQARFSQDCNLVFVPDDQFENYLISKGLDDVLDDYVALNNIIGETSLNLFSNGIINLTGIEAFIALEEFTSLANPISSLITESLVNLKKITIIDSEIEQLDLTKNINLLELSVVNANIFEIDLKNNLFLQVVDLGGNKLASIDFSKNEALTYLNVAENPLITLDISKNNLLETLGVNSVSLTELDLSEKVNLKTLFCQNGTLNKLNVKNGANQYLTTFNATGNPELNCITVDNSHHSTANWLNIDGHTSFSGDCDFKVYVPDDEFERELIAKGLDDIEDDYVTVSDIIGLRELSLISKDIKDFTGLRSFSGLREFTSIANPILSIDLTGNFNLLKLIIINSPELDNLDLNENPLLTYVTVSATGIQTLNITRQTDLQYLELGRNNLFELKVDQNPNLTSLSFGVNPVEEIDLSLNTKLETLNVYETFLTDLDLTNNINLENLNCRFGVFASINLKNGNNSKIKLFDALDNPGLTCIQVDDAAYSTANWTNISPQTSFNEDCTVPGSIYCDSNGNSTAFEYVERVVIGSIDNSSIDGIGGYEDFTSLSTDLTIGSAVEISITPYWPSGFPDNEGYSVWIDFNQDGDFEDSGEQVVSQSSTSTSPLKVSFVVSNGLIGPTTMRVSMKNGSIPLPCESFSSGEVEDYTVNIIPTRDEMMITQYYEGTSNSKWLEIKNISGETIPESTYHLVLFDESKLVDVSSEFPTATISIPEMIAEEVILFKNVDIPTAPNLINLGLAKALTTDVCDFDGDDMIIISRTIDDSSFDNRVDIIGTNGNWGMDKSLARANDSEIPSKDFDINDWVELNIEEEVDNANYNSNIALGTYVMGSIIWDGSNWNSATIPDRTRDVEISGGYDVGNGSIIAKNLEINTDLDFDAGGTNSIIVYGDLEVIGTLTIGDKESLVMYDDNALVTGNIIKKENSTARNHVNDITYWSSPIKEGTIGGVFSGVEPSRIFYYDQSRTTASDPNDDPDGTYWNVWILSGQSDLMVPGKGFAAEGLKGTTGIHNLTFNGDPNNGLVEIDAFFNTDDIANLDNDFNLIGNPYPSAINIDSFFVANSDVLYATAYLWTHNTEISTGGDFVSSDYATYNLSGGVAVVGNPKPENKIGSGQGFFVRSKRNGKITFTNKIRLIGRNDLFFKNDVPKESNDKNRIWLELKTDQGGADQILISLSDLASDAVDSDYDALKLNAGNPISFYSVIDSAKYVIQGRSLNNVDRPIAIGFDTDVAPRSFSIGISDIEGDLISSDVVLRDNYLNVEHDLNKGDYQFEQLEKGKFIDRFTISFTGIALSTDDIIDEEGVVISWVGRNINLEASKRISSVKVYDVLGRALIKKKPNVNSVLLETNQFKQGTIFMIETILENGESVFRKTIQYQN